MRQYTIIIFFLQCAVLTFLPPSKIIPRLNNDKNNFNPKQNTGNKYGIVKDEGVEILNLDSPIVAVWSSLNACAVSNLLLGVFARTQPASGYTLSLKKNEREKSHEFQRLVKKKEKKNNMSSANKQKQSWKCQIHTLTTPPPHTHTKKRVQRSPSEGVHLYGCS